MQYYCPFCSQSSKQPMKYKAINLDDIEGLTVTEAVRQFRVGRIVDSDCTHCNPGGGMEQINYFSKLPQILVFKQEKSVANDRQLQNGSFIYETNLILRDPDRTVCHYSLFNLLVFIQQEKEKIYLLFFCELVISTTSITNVKNLIWQRHFYTLYGVVLQQVDGNYISYIHHDDGWVGFSDQNVSHLICDRLLSIDKYSPLLYNLVIRFPGLINFHMKMTHACSFTRREIQRYGFLIVHLI